MKYIGKLAIALAMSVAVLSVNTVSAAASKTAAGSAKNGGATAVKPQAGQKGPQAGQRGPHGRGMGPHMKRSDMKKPGGMGPMGRPGRMGPMGGPGMMMRQAIPAEQLAAVLAKRPNLPFLFVDMGTGDAAITALKALAPMPNVRVLKVQNLKGDMEPTIKEKFPNLMRIMLDNKNIDLTNNSELITDLYGDYGKLEILIGTGKPDEDSVLRELIEVLGAAPKRGGMHPGFGRGGAMGRPGPGGWGNQRGPHGGPGRGGKPGMMKPGMMKQDVAKPGAPKVDAAPAAPKADAAAVKVEAAAAPEAPKVDAAPAAVAPAAS